MARGASADTPGVTEVIEEPLGRPHPQPAPDMVQRAARIAALRDLAILDTLPEPAYDDLASLAAAVCRTDVGAVNFVDGDRHWTKAIVGVADGQRASVAADLSLCAATIRSPEGVITVGDTLDGDLWREHLDATGEPLPRFYAGASLVVSGERVGVVCVFGDEPRDFTPAEEAGLSALARQASAHLELRRRNLALRELAITDPLTGLANRTLLFDHLDLALAGSRRSAPRVGVVFCDVDEFKSVNDRFGHDAGDRLLRDIANRLSSAVRDVDTVARFAGDEFVVICPGLAGTAELAAVGERVAQSVATIGPLPDGSPPPRLTVGAVLAEDGELAVDALERADAAMYAAKLTC